MLIKSVLLGGQLWRCMKIGRIRVQTTISHELVALARAKGVNYSYALSQGIRALAGECPKDELDFLRQKIDRMSRIIDLMRERIEMQGEQMVVIRNRL